ncbi:phage major capsid protein [Campylobacter insulaenigrae]|uniref:Major capsid protein, HK97 family n=1 Tax=Campylobacter insulaenigrae NCTC 12927 TaxID=1031564 RepID=A0A0A8H0T3_9BACT|nr:phage major capsid protein [Campylobacter insulaenigrae]AJC87798.1 major capsid protein, HK97 family [Campylobacter insulaenigrae NCTC 12927]VEH94143.1 major capsid protein, HK97 family [Campylobacter insulaenigrae]
MQKIREDIGALHKQMSELSNKAKDEKRTFSTEEEQKYNQMVKDFESKRNELLRLEEEQKRESFLNEVVSVRLEQNPHPQREDEKDSMKSFVKYLRSGIIDKSLQRDALNESATDKGGVLVPTTLQSKIRSKLTDLSVIRKLATVQKSSTNQDIPILEDISGFGWIDEMANFNEANASFSKLTIGAHKLGGIIKISEELLNDNISNLESFLIRKSAEKIAQTEEEAFIKGDGNKKPAGIINTKTQYELASNSGITSNDVIDAFFTLKSAYRTNASWLVGDDFMKALYKLVDGDGRPLWMPALSSGGYDTILGKKVTYCSSLDGFGASKTPAIFGDFSFYEIWDRETMSFTRLNELYAQNDLVGIKVRSRLDAKLITDEAICKIVTPS